MTKSGDLLDCLFFWNLRALRPYCFVDLPMFILGDVATGQWSGFKEALHERLSRRDEFSPDVILWSRNVPESHLLEIAEDFDLRPSKEGVRVGHRWPADIRSAPFTFKVNPPYDPRAWVSFHRTYGQKVRVRGTPRLSATRYARKPL